MSQGHLISVIAAAGFIALGAVVLSLSFAISKIAEARRERRRSEASHQRFADVIELAADWVWETDSQHRFVYLSERLAEVTGLDPHHFLGRSRVEIPQIEARDDAAWARHVADLRAHRAFRNFRYSFIDAFGRKRTFQVNGKPIFDDRGRFQGHRGTGSDLTETEEARTDASEAEARARKVLDSAYDVFIALDEQGRIVDWNHAAEQTLGWSRSEALGSYARDLFVPEDLREAHARLIAKLREGDPRALLPHVHTTAQRRDGTRFRCDLTLTQTETRHGRQFNGFLRDVTEQEEREAALQRAREHAEAANRTKSDFLAAMSHELRTPLNAILGFSDVLLRRPDLAADKRTEYLSDIHNSGRHLLDLINDVLDVSKVEAGRLELYDEAVDLAAVGRSCIRLLSERANQGGVRLVLDAAPGLPEICADPQRVKQVIINLVNNAVKFTESGGHVVVGVQAPEAGGLRVSVRDTGIGMDPDQLDKALAPFSQLDSGYARRQEGSGLGLALAKMLTELHDGRLEVQTAPKAGTTVTVGFPEWRVLRERSTDATGPAQADTDQGSSGPVSAAGRG